MPRADTIARIPLPFTETLEGIDLLAELSPRELRVLSGYLLVRDAEAGEVIFREGEAGDSLCFLAHGEVRIEKEGDDRLARTVAVERGHRAIGEMALMDGEPRSATCIATQDSRLLVLTRSSFDRLGHAHPALALRVAMSLARLVSRRLRQASGRLVDYLEA